MCNNSSTIIGSMCCCGCDGDSQKFLTFDCDGITDGTGCPQLSLSDLAIAFDSIRKYQTHIPSGGILTAGSDIVALKSNIPVKRFSGRKTNRVIDFEIILHSIERTNNDYDFVYSIVGIPTSSLVFMNDRSEFSLAYDNVVKQGNSEYLNKSITFYPNFEPLIFAEEKKMRINSCSEQDEIDFIENIVFNGLNIRLNLKLVLEAKSYDSSISLTGEHIILSSVEYDINEKLHGGIFEDLLSVRLYDSENGGTVSENVTYSSVGFFALHDYISEGVFVFENLENPVHFYNDRKASAKINMLEIFKPINDEI